MSYQSSNAISPELSGELPVLQSSEELIRSGNPSGAVAELKKQLKTTSENWRLHYALGDALQAAGRDEEAIGSYIAATRLKPDLATAYVKIGRAFFSRGMTDPALFWLRRALQVDANCESGLLSLAVAEAQVGCRERVAELLGAWMAADPGNPIRQHLSTAILGTATPAKAAEEYVIALFDGYAPVFDQSLARLGYCGPQLIADALQHLDMQPAAAWNILDAGCGTGLVGPMLKPYARRLVGVDLSDLMLRQAETRRIYDELIRADMVAYMQSSGDPFHLVTASDALTYCGELESFFAACADCLVPSGHVIVLVEAIEGSEVAQGYRLNQSGRFAHHEDYIRKCLADNGLVTRYQSDRPMRNDPSRPVPTLLFAAEKPRLCSS